MMPPPMYGGGGGYGGGMGGGGGPSMTGGVEDCGDFKRGQCTRVSTRAGRQFSLPYSRS
jgi:hypothetical protein